jgi:hypothetical protein
VVVIRLLYFLGLGHEIKIATDGILSRQKTEKQDDDEAPSP